jgi:hypothetical protein
MAKIVLGVGSSHAPQLAMQPSQWRAYGDRSRTQNQHWFRGKTYSFEELVEARKDEHFEKQLDEEIFSARFDACQRAIAHLADSVAAAKPDILVIMGDDQHESFLDDNMPSIAIYHGKNVNDAPGGGAGGGMFQDVVVGKVPPEKLTQPTDDELGQYLIETMIANEFDVARTNSLQRREGAIGHAFYYVYRRLMDNAPVPSVPIMVNTYFPPNAPTAMRCYKFGKALRKAIEDWDSDKRVALFASGGLSHTVIEEDFDQIILDGLMNDDVKKLTDHDDLRFRAGTSEIKNWIALAGAMSGTSLRPNVVDYVPCYRTEAGNGCAMGMAEWV